MTQHPARAAHRARELAEAGWDLKTIRKILKDEGIADVKSSGTIMRWIDPKYTIRDNADKQRRSARNQQIVQDGRIRTNIRSHEALMARAKALRGLGLDDIQIAAVIALDFPWAETDVKSITWALRTGKIPAAWKTHKVKLPPGPKPARKVKARRSRS